MKKRDRVIAAMNNMPVDRPPVGFWFHFPGEKKFGQASIDAHLDYYNNTDTDLAKLMCDGHFNYPNPAAQAVKETKDWYAMQPIGMSDSFFAEQLERAKGVRDGLKSDCLVIYNVFAPFSYLRFGTSDALVMEHIRKDPDAVEYALKVVAADVKEFCDKLINEAGMDGVYYCVQGGEKFRFSVDEYRTLVTPTDLEVLSYANSLSDTNVLHCCGWAGDPNNIEVWQDYPAKAVNWACFIENMDLTDGKKFFGGKCVLGGFDNRPQGLIANGTEEEIKAYTKALAAKHGTTGIMFGADCTLPAEIDVKRIRWVVEAAQELAL